MAPILETALLALGLKAIALLSPNRFFDALVSAVLWGCIHAAFGLLWFFGTVWSFFVFSYAFLVWRPTSFRAAFAAAAVPHAAINAIALLSLQAIADNAA